MTPRSYHEEHHFCPFLWTLDTPYVMILPGRLASTTLGDLLGMLHRSAVTGTLELVEERGRTHRVHLRAGLVVSAESDGASPPLGVFVRRVGVVDDETSRRALLRALASRRLHGEVLVRDFGAPVSSIAEALRLQLVDRIERMDRVADAQIKFRASVRLPVSALVDHPLQRPDFLHGKKRKRQVREQAMPPSSPRLSLRESALRVLGVSSHASSDDIRHAFRLRVREVHPDLHPHATEDQRRAFERTLSDLNEAYRTLVA